MFQDLNRPDGVYGRQYDRMTNVRSRREIQSFTKWENEAINHYIVKDSKGVETLLSELRSKIV